MAIRLTCYREARPRRFPAAGGEVVIQFRRQHQPVASDSIASSCLRAVGLSGSATMPRAKSRIGCW